MSSSAFALIGDTFQARIGIWKCWFLRRGENRSTRGKTSRSREENQQQTIRSINGFCYCCYASECNERALTWIGPDRIGSDRISKTRTGLTKSGPDVIRLIKPGPDPKMPDLFRPVNEMIPKWDRKWSQDRKWLLQVIAQKNRMACVATAFLCRTGREKHWYDPHV